MPCWKPYKFILYHKHYRDNGIEFRGIYRITKNTGETVEENVEGVVPEKIDIKGYFILCKLKKKSGKGILRVELLKSGNLISTDETELDGSYVTVSGR